MIHRREMLQVGYSSFFGVGLTGLLERQAAVAASGANIEQRAKSVVL
ncbi:MAG: DUF1501 domain-containing protein, partial [Planctomycetaceae bacterium]|nr:DUF1501 domain-containing protein [Planctomycetaceae bacterium]